MTNPFVWKAHYNVQDMQLNPPILHYQGHFSLQQYPLRHKYFSGQWSPKIYREQVVVPNSVAAVLYDPRQDKLGLVEQFRIGPLGASSAQSPWLLEVVAGYIDANELPITAIKREIQEESGYDPYQLLPISHYYTSPGGSTEQTWVFCGLIKAAAQSHFAGLAAEHEDIKVHILPATQVFDWLNQGLLTSSATIIALQWLNANRAELQDKAQST
jgi:ADP-ribose pyrophosphatase